MPERRPVIWLASFPKSGNTWLRGMLCRAIAGMDAALEDMGALIPALNSDDDFQGELLDRARGDGAAPTIAKTHRPFYEIETREIMRSGAFQRFATGGIVYVVRNPLDVALSLFDFVRLNDPRDEPEEVLFARFLEAFIANEGRVEAENVHAVDLNEHVQSYLYAASLHRTLFVRYEDMHLNPAAELARVCDFAGVTLDAATAAAVAESCSFARMRRLEEENIAMKHDGGHEFYRPWRADGYAKGLRFFNRGQVGRGYERIEPSIRRRIRQTFREIFETFGYDADEAAAA